MPKPIVDFTSTAAPSSSGVFSFVAPPNGGFFATQSYAATMFFSFIAGIFLTVAFSQTRQGNQVLANSTAALVQSANTKLKGIKANWQTMEATKMALVVRRDLKMGQGKVAAQCAHAAVGVIDRIYEENEKLVLKKGIVVSSSSGNNINNNNDESSSVLSEAERLASSSPSTSSSRGSSSAAATAHAEFGADKDGCCENGGEEDQCLDYAEKWMTWLTAWRSAGSAKVVLQVETETDLMNIVNAAKKANLPTTYIRDAGRTQIAAGSKTVCAVGPAPVSLVDSITGKLKLL